MAVSTGRSSSGDATRRAAGQIALVLAGVVVVQHVGEQPPPAVELAPRRRGRPAASPWPLGQGRAGHAGRRGASRTSWSCPSGPSAVAACPGSVQLPRRPAWPGRRGRAAGGWGARSSWQRPSPGPVHPDIGKPPQIVPSHRLTPRRLNFGRTSYVVVVMATLSYDVRRIAVPVAAMLLLSGCSGSEEPPRATQTSSPAPTTSAPSEPSPTASPTEPDRHHRDRGTGDHAEALPRLPPRLLPTQARRRRPPPGRRPRADGRLHVVRRVVPQRAPAGDGVLNIPTGAGPFPAVVLAHGYIDPAIYVSGQGMTRERGYLASQGFVAFHVDYRNHAGSDDDPLAARRLRPATPSTSSTPCRHCAARRACPSTTGGSRCSAGRWAAAWSTRPSRSRRDWSGRLRVGVGELAGGRELRPLHPRRRRPRTCPVRRGVRAARAAGPPSSGGRSARAPTSTGSPSPAAGPRQVRLDLPAGLGPGVVPRPPRRRRRRALAWYPTSTRSARSSSRRWRVRRGLLPRRAGG